MPILTPWMQLFLLQTHLWRKFLVHCPGLTTPKQQELQQSVVVYTCELFNFSLKTAHILFEVFAIDGKCFLIVVYSQGLLMPVPASYTKGSSVLSPCPMALNPAKSFADTSWVYTKFGLRLALIGSIACASQIELCTFSLVT